MYFVLIQLQGYTRIHISNRGGGPNIKLGGCSTLSTGVGEWHIHAVLRKSLRNNRGEKLLKNETISKRAFPESCRYIRKTGVVNKKINVCWNRCITSSIHHKLIIEDVKWTIIVLVDITISCNKTTLEDGGKRNFKLSVEAISHAEKCTFVLFNHFLTQSERTSSERILSSI